MAVGKSVENQQQKQQQQTAVTCTARKRTVKILSAIMGFKACPECSQVTLQQALVFLVIWLFWRKNLVKK